MKKRIVGVLLVFLAIVMVACGGQGGESSGEAQAGEAQAPEKEYQYVSGADTVAAESAEDVQIVDLRDEESYKKGSLNSAVHVDLSKPDDEAYREAFKENASQIDKDKKVYFICFSGNKCAKGAIDILEEQGYDPNNLFIIEEGAKGADLSGAFSPQE